MLCCDSRPSLSAGPIRCNGAVDHFTASSCHGGHRRRDTVGKMATGRDGALCGDGDGDVLLSDYQPSTRIPTHAPNATHTPCVCVARGLGIKLVTSSSGLARTEGCAPARVSDPPGARRTSPGTTAKPNAPGHCPSLAWSLGLQASLLRTCKGSKDGSTRRYPHPELDTNACQTKGSANAPPTSAHERHHPTPQRPNWGFILQGGRYTTAKAPTYRYPTLAPPRRQSTPVPFVGRTTMSDI